MTLHVEIYSFHCAILKCYIICPKRTPITQIMINKFLYKTSYNEMVFLISLCRFFYAVFRLSEPLLLLLFFG